MGTRDNDHIRGTSVEDILEDDYQGPMYFTNEEVEKLFATTPHYMHPPLPLSVKPPQRRKELLESYIRKPKYSVRRVKLLCEWLNSLHLWPTARITVRNLHKEMLNGLLLARMVKRVNPGVIFVNLNQKALTKKSAMQNLEQALGHIWRSKSLNNSRIPSAAEIYNGSTFKIAVLLNEFFGVYVQRPLYKTALKTLKWYHGILRQYLLPIPPTTFSEGDLSGIWPHFQSGTALFCVIFHFFGPSIVGEKKTHIRVDPLRIVRDAACYGDMISNVEYVFDLLRALDIDVVWEAADWLTNPDTEFIILQLNYIYNTLKTRQCCLPPAQGQVAGITSGPNGDPVVAGIVFADSKVANSKVLVSSTRKAVLLGNGKDALPLLPIDRASRSTGRFNSTSCPLGMISHAVDIPLTYKSLKESKLKLERDDWNKSASVKSEKHTPAGEQIIALLRGTKIDNAVSDLKISTDDRSVSPNGDKKSKLSPETKSTRLAASPTSAKKIEHISKAPTQRLRELDIQMKSLEKNMQTSQGQLRSLEDDLATRYLELEASAHYCDIQEYEDALANLETERIELEQEKSRLQVELYNKCDVWSK